MKFEKVNPATGAAAPGFSRSTNKLAGNQHTGYSNDGRLVNKGRGPTVGNKSSKHTPGTDSMPALQCGKEMFTGHAQVRTPGGTKEMPKTGKDSFDFGRGPTKGNQL